MEIISRSAPTVLTTASSALAPRQLVVERAAITVDSCELRDVSLGGWVFGRDVGSAPAVVIVGGITATPFPFGDGGSGAAGGTKPWWPALAAPGLIDVTRCTVLCPCWPGNGSTWAGFDDLDALPPLSVSGLADLIEVWLEGVGCTQPVIFAGASLGALVNVAFAVRHPHRCGKVISVSGALRPDGWGTAVRHLQRELVRDGLRNGTLHTAMMRARQLGILTYRGREELDARFGKLTPGRARPPVADYLDYNGRKFADRFPVGTFLLLSEAIDRMSLGADRTAVREALRRVTAETVVVGVASDLLFPWELQVELHEELRAAGARSSLWKMNSIYGHDAFLADQERLAGVLLEAGAFQ